MSDKVLIGDHSDKVQADIKIIATIEGETVEVKCDQGDTILDALVKAGHTPPYSCMAGSCMACTAKVEEGQVYQESEGILGDDNLANHETLTCQAHPISQVVKLIFEEE
ncbi:MAG: 2Fe-2S iron-sulfur cluster binding domain-containing protein [Bdellovibrionaceae bacterium]|jgi:ring-1,2-phenylacetyl-CoA epoxidase subunit PaaE|nr:2Fe-2S iron-sulfur cluster binding domain-containing protein [Pseudobdellovibrionaceae bacterium]